MHHAIERVCRLAGLQRLGLMTSDTGYADSLWQVQAKGTSVVALVPRALLAESRLFLLGLDGPGTA